MDELQAIPPRVRMFPPSNDGTFSSRPFLKVLGPVV
jgi:hypothetical protein